MTSAEKGEEGVKKCSKFADKEGGGGVNKSQNYVDVIYGLGGEKTRRATPPRRSEMQTKRIANGGLLTKAGL